MGSGREREKREERESAAGKAKIFGGKKGS